MIYKSYFLENNINSLNEKITLFYGENLGLKNDLKGKIIYNNKNSEILRFTQEELTKNNRALINEIQNISLFDRITRSNKSIFPESILLFQNTLLISMTGNRQYIEGDIQNSRTICIRLRSDFDNLILLPC